MNAFTFHNPTKLIFGENQIKQLRQNITQYGEKVLLVYGGGSIKKTGLYDQVLAELDGLTIFELAGVEPNPRVTTAQKGADLIKDHGIDVVLAVGGGSVIDCTKLIVAAAHYDGPAWDIVIGKHTPTQATPFGTILTLAATGSEMNSGSVITNLETKQKYGWGSPLVYPAFSILDPTYTFTLPKNQTVNGIVDMMSHLFEQYYNEATNTPIQDRMIEGILKEIIAAAPTVLAEPENYAARETIMVAGTLALNGYMRWGYNGDWATHSIEHAVSAIYDIAHAEGLAIVMPNWMRYVMPQQVTRFKQMAVNVFNIPTTVGSDEDIAAAGVDALQAFWKGIGAPTRLADRDIDDTHLDQMAKLSLRGERVGNTYPLSVDDVYQILKQSL